MMRSEFDESDVKVVFELSVNRYPGADDQLMHRLQVAIRRAVAEEMALAKAALVPDLAKADAAALTRFSSLFKFHDTDWEKTIADHIEEKRAEASV